MGIAAKNEDVCSEHGAGKCAGIGAVAFKERGVSALLDNGVAKNLRIKIVDGAKQHKVPRYELLCQQMEYTKDALEYGIP